MNRVHAVVADAAGPALAAQRADLSIREMSELYEQPSYECPVVVLTPITPDAAALSVEVQADDLWWVIAADGPGSELHSGIEKTHGNRYALLGSLVAAVVAGRYRHGPCTERVPRLLPRLRGFRESHGWCESYETDNGPFTSRHFGRPAPLRERRFAPYL